jgi:hypothetical protein
VALMWLPTSLPTTSASFQKARGSARAVSAMMRPRRAFLPG